VSAPVRFKLILEYDGGPFAGWQRQENGPSVQEAVERAARALSGVDATAVAAGRTDAGVHALAMPVHLDLPDRFDAQTVKDALNFHLKPAPVAVLSAETAPEGFHARFSATARRYLYRIVDRRAPLALEAGRAWRIARPLDADAMSAAASLLVGKHDFTTFRSVHCQSRSPVRTLSELSVSRAGEAVVIRASAPSFLHRQVRSMAGTLAEVGLGRMTPEDVAAALAARERSACGPVAPPHGLYFAGADY
jgi:tRNA pseudouridine38-40 synthase